MSTVPIPDVWILLDHRLLDLQVSLIDLIILSGMMAEAASDKLTRVVREH